MIGDNQNSEYQAAQGFNRQKYNNSYNSGYGNQNQNQNQNIYAQMQTNSMHAMGNNNMSPGDYYFNNNNSNSNSRQEKYNPEYKSNNNFKYPNQGNPKFKKNLYQNNFISNSTNESIGLNFPSSPDDEHNVIQSLKYASENYSGLVSLNTQNLGLTEKVRQQSSPRFFVIKSFTEEDIHKSMKYGCWSSTREGNKKLSAAFEDCRANNSDLFLFFSMNGSGRFVGVSKMTGKVDDAVAFEYWAMDEVWRGLMPVEWQFVKDIPNRFLKDIRLSNNAFKPVTNSRDTQEIPRAEGEQFMSVFEDFVFQTALLQHFQYYDERQDLFEKARKSSSMSVQSQQFFK